MAEHDPQRDPQSESGVKVSDRRHFTESGERRAGADRVEEPRFDPPPPPAPPKAAAPAAAAGREPEPSQNREAQKAPAPPRPERLAAREINFSGLVQDLYATCAMQLGADMGSGQPGQLDLEGARETIDLMGLLQHKTHGNLDVNEEKLLSSVLFELRRAYVEVARAATARVQPPPRR